MSAIPRNPHPESTTPREWHSHPILWGVVAFEMSLVKKNNVEQPLSTVDLDFACNSWVASFVQARGYWLRTSRELVDGMSKKSLIVLLDSQETTVEIPVIVKCDFPVSWPFPSD